MMRNARGTLLIGDGRSICASAEQVKRRCHIEVSQRTVQVRSALITSAQLQVADGRVPQNVPLVNVNLRTVSVDLTRGAQA